LEGGLDVWDHWDHPFPSWLPGYLSFTLSKWEDCAIRSSIASPNLNDGKILIGERVSNGCDKIAWLSPEVLIK